MIQSTPDNFERGEAAAQRTVDELTFQHRVGLIIATVVGVSLLLIFLWQAVYVLLLAFAGILFAIFLRAMSDPLARWMGMSPRWALAIVIMSVFALIVGGGLMLAPNIAGQVQQMQTQVPQAVDHIITQAQQHPLGAQLVEEVRQWTASDQARPAVAQQAMTVFSVSLTALGVILLVLFVGIYLAISPEMYRDGLVRLFPKPQRARAREVLDSVGYVLKWWLIGRILAMAFVGVLTTIGLWIIGVPLALSLGILAALLDFVPNIGPIIAAVPAVLLAFVEDPWKALYVVILYLVVQQVESYVLTPLIQQRAVKLPPALTIVSQVLFYILVGPLGLLLATPLTAAAMEVIKGVYVHDVLDDREVQMLGDQPERSKDDRRRATARGAMKKIAASKHE